MRTHKDLSVWKGSVQLVIDTYSITKDFPKDELFGLVSQMRRAAVSIPSNIAEGAARQYSGDYLRFLQIASSSLAELETQFIISEKLTFISNEQTSLLTHRMNHIRAQLSGLIRSIKSKGGK